MTFRPCPMLLLLCLVPATGCLSFTRADTGDEVLFDHLYQRDLSAFEQRLAVEHHTRNADAWTRVADAWLDFANCRPVELDSVGDAADEPLAFLMYASLALEDARRATFIASGEQTASETLAGLREQAFFARKPAHVGDDKIEWPSEDEAWADEVPAPTKVESDCEALRERIADATVPAEETAEDDATEGSAKSEAPPTDDEPEEEATRPKTVTDWRREQLRAIDRIVHLQGILEDDERGGNVTALMWRARMHGAQLAHRMWRIEEERAREAEIADAEALERTDAFRHRAIEYVEPLAERSKPGSIDAPEYARAQFLYATLLQSEGRRAEALAVLADVDGIEEDQRNRWAARYLRLRLLTDSARWDEAATLAEDLPPHGSRYFAPYVHRVSMALRRSGAEDRFLATAMRAFRDRPYRQSPFLQALYFDVLHVLAGFPFDERVVELLEEMGPRSETFDRVEAYGRVSLDRGRPENAAAAARWLLANDANARHHPRYHAIKALAAFIDDRPEKFQEALESLVARPKKVLEAVPVHRRARFFAHADAELARVLRQMLPVMAEWGDSDVSRDRRQRWLKIIVERTQQFLRNTDESLARPALVELYRLASALLEEHPRGYAERVGSQEPAPLVLGMVRVRGGNLDDAEPTIRVHLPEHDLLTLVPRDDEPPARWTFGWPEDEDEEVADEG